MNLISFPRSGQHLISEVLRLIYKEHNYDFSYCEYYRCCNKVPCQFGSMFMKNHDFLLQYEIKTNEKYIVL